MTQPFRIGPWTIEPDLHRIRGVEGEIRVVSHKVMAALLCLASRPGEVVSKQGLVDDVWEGAFTSDESLTTVVYELRKALGDSARRPRFIETIRKGGYRLMVSVEPAVASRPVMVSEAASVPSPEAKSERSAMVDGSTGVGSQQTTGRVVDVEVGSSSELRSQMTTARNMGRGTLWAIGALVLATAAINWSGARSPNAESPAQPSRQQVETLETAPRLASLAVLPLHSFGETCGEDGFAGGLTEMLVVDLAAAVPLEVLPSLVTRTLETPWNLGAVTDQLEADLVIEGTVIRSGQRLWLSVQLVDTASGRLLWGGSYERKMDDALLLQRDLAGSITDEVRRIVVDAASTAASSDGLEGWKPQAVASAPE